MLARKNGNENPIWSWNDSVTKYVCWRKKEDAAYHKKMAGVGLNYWDKNRGKMTSFIFGDGLVSGYFISHMQHIRGRWNDTVRKDNMTPCGQTKGRRGDWKYLVFLPKSLAYLDLLVEGWLGCAYITVLLWYHFRWWNWNSWETILDEWLQPQHRWDNCSMKFMCPWVSTTYLLTVKFQRGAGIGGEKGWT